MRTKKPSSKPPAHVLIRVRSENGLTVEAHSDVIEKHGAALFGKIGQPIGPDFRAELNEQIERGIPTYLFITTREGWNGPYVTYSCLLLSVHDRLDPGQKSLVPSYYLGEASKIKTWFEVRSITRLTREEMNRICVVSSGRSIMAVIKSSAAVFRVVAGGSPEGRAPKQSASL